MLLLASFILLIFTGMGRNSEKERQRPNILFIAVDDLRNELGSYGSTIAISPNIDALAAESSVFNHHYVQVPTCGASRHALLTGMRPYKRVHLTNKAIEMELSNRLESEVPETFIHRLKRAGYYTVGIGKISHSADGYVYGYEEQASRKRELPHSWSELLFDPGKWQTGWNAFFAYANGENRQSLKKQVKPYEVAEVTDIDYPDGLTTQLALKKLQLLKEKKQPFFMGVGFFKPHLPFNAPKKYWDLYDPDSIPISPNPTIPENIHLASLHESGEFNQYALGDEQASLTRPISDPYARKLRHAYLAAVSYIDAQIGMLCQQLKNLDLYENTIIVIWGDHGWHLGDQRIWGKHTLFENALKSPLIIKPTYEHHTAKKIAAVVETVDVYPTLLELCDVSIKHPIDGESLVELMQKKKVKKEGVAYSYFKNGISARNARYRFTKYFREAAPTIELYDYEIDPLETKNRAATHPELLQKLLPILEQGNTGLYNSD